jgi:hypothetical protein
MARTEAKIVSRLQDISNSRALSGMPPGASSNWGYTGFLSQTDSLDGEPVLGLLGMVAASRFPTLDSPLDGATQTRVFPREFLIVHS